MKSMKYKQLIVQHLHQKHNEWDEPNLKFDLKKHSRRKYLCRKEEYVIRVWGTPKREKEKSPY